MFGFPESPSDWGSKEYLRLFVIIMFYVSVRPLIQIMYEKLGNRQRQREKKRTEEELIQRHKQERVREKLGITQDEPDKKELASASVSNVTSVQASLKNRREAREAKKTQKKTRKEEIMEDMPSDEDVSDLVS